MESKSKKCRITVDGEVATERDKVYEILQVYVNDEVVEWVPHENICDDVPLSCKVWMSKYACQRECNRLNEFYQELLNKLVNKHR